MKVEITATVLVAFASLVFTAVNWLYTRFGVEIKLAERLREVEVNVNFIMKFFDRSLPTLGLVVKAPTHQRMDTLIDRFVNKECSIPETYELRNWLRDYLVELEQEFAKKKQVAVDAGTTLPEVGKILATTVLLATVGLQLIQHEQGVKAPRKVQWWQLWKWPIFSRA